MHCVRIKYYFVLFSSLVSLVNSSMFDTFKNAQLMNHKILKRIIHQITNKKRNIKR